MQIIDKIKTAIFENDVQNFDDLAMELFYFQSQNCAVYKSYLQHLKIDYKSIKEVETIPHLPISFFKSNKITSFPNLKEEHIFESSGTTNSDKSKHYIYDLKLYQKNALNAFNNFYENIADYHILALLPSYLEQQNSSLIFMVDYFMNLSKDNNKNSYLNDYKELANKLEALNTNNKKVLLIGVSYALWNFAEQFKLNLSNTIVMETGGMKGKRKEIVRSELHQILQNSFGTKTIHSEYGMCELLSQSYSNGNGIFKTAATKKVIVKELNDPFNVLQNGISGKINVIDLANIYTCAFIETADIGKKLDQQNFEILGRMDGSELRGCNLML